jgi:hypothetical protein
MLRNQEYGEHYLEYESKIEELKQLEHDIAVERALFGDFMYAPEQEAEQLRQQIEQRRDQVWGTRERTKPQG